MQRYRNSFSQDAHHGRCMGECAVSTQVLVCIGSGWVVLLDGLGDHTEVGSIAAAAHVCFLCL